MPTAQRSHQAHPEEDVTLAEDGEAIGTVRQFANRLGLPESQVLPCLQCHAEEAIFVRAGDASEQLLIVGADGVDALFGCAASASSP
ncbi:hypothetical protein [Salinibacter altiplanensis]|uniref:hypothetical protein n=1 Tax=Salinibacter altiplanensis TaxID=1803181 RepID=UPI0012FFE57E|nr:hypothetical protein [Salinibacter altiplanensis]